ncbi:MAG: phosphoglycerate kinase [Candidatus Hodarchaeales archaeon]|jgi:phosphoglycerate kinase
MRTLSDIDLENKICLVRVDLNCPLDEHKEILDVTRIKAHSKTIKYIADRKGKVVVIAHQGRPGSADFSSLKLHTKSLQKILGESYEVNFYPHTHGLEAEKSIKRMNSGDILVLENVRNVQQEMLNKNPEEHSKNPYVVSLAKVGQIFVNDAFSAAHRSHISLVGFTTLMPSIAGLIMEKEVTNLQKVVDNPEKPCVFVLGGIKPEDSLKIIDYVLSNEIADTVLTGGTVSQILLVASGKSLGKPSMDFLERKKILQFVDNAKELVEKFGNSIKTQSDFATDNGGRRVYSILNLPLDYPILDIGDSTIKEYGDIIKNASTVVLNGPMGKFEDPGFDKGTIGIFEAMGKSKCFSLAGGGHSVSIIEKYKFDLSYVSTAGKALLLFLMGSHLPAIEALNENEKLDFG